jgi:hypothetical protein
MNVASLRQARLFGAASTSRMQLLEQLKTHGRSIVKRVADVGAAAYRRVRSLAERVRSATRTGDVVRTSSRLRVPRLLTALLVVLVIAASVAGLAIEGMYRDPAGVAAMLRGYDAVALGIAVPILVATLLPARRGSPRAQLLWVGMLMYCAYNYGSYVFGTVFNAAFLLHAGAFSLAVYALALALSNLDIVQIARSFRRRTPVRLISAVLAVLAGGLGGMWIFYSLRFAITGEVPGESRLVLPPSAVHLGYALDLALLVPAYALAAVLLWKRAAWGYVLAGSLLPFTVVYQLNYVTALVFQAWERVPGAVAFDPQEVPIVGAALAATVLLFRDRPASVDLKHSLLLQRQ